MCMDIVEQVRSRRSSEDASVGEQDTQIVWAVYGRIASSARLVDAKSRAEGPGTVRHQNHQPVLW